MYLFFRSFILRFDYFQLQKYFDLLSFVFFFYFRHRRRMSLPFNSIRNIYLNRESFFFFLCCSVERKKRKRKKASERTNRQNYLCSINYGMPRTTQNEWNEPKNCEEMKKVQWFLHVLRAIANAHWNRERSMELCIFFFRSHTNTRKDNLFLTFFQCVFYFISRLLETLEFDLVDSPVITVLHVKQNRQETSKEMNKSWINVNAADRTQPMN